MNIENLLEEKELDPIYLKVFESYPDVVTVKEVCKMLRIDSKKAYRIIKSGELKAIRLDRTVRIAKVWVLEYLQERGENAALTVAKERQNSILEFCKHPKSRVEIQRHIGMCDKNHFCKSLLNSLLSEGLIARTIPDTPNHIKQKYVTVEK